MIRRPPRSTRTDTLFPCTTLFRSELRGVFDAARDADYEELAREARALCEGEYVVAADVGRLRKRLNEVAAIDFFGAHGRSEEHTSELQSLMRISYAVFCLKKKTEPPMIELRASRLNTQ